MTRKKAKQEIDLDQFRLDDENISAEIPTKSKRTRTSRQQCSLFLRGPIPWPWLSTAMRLPGSSLQVALLIRLLEGLNKARTFAWRPSLAEEVGLSRHAVRRALEALEEAGLILVNRRPGQTYRIMVLELDAASSD